MPLAMWKTRFPENEQVAWRRGDDGIWRDIHLGKGRDLEK